MAPEPPRTRQANAKFLRWSGYGLACCLAGACSSDGQRCSELVSARAWSDAAVVCAREHARTGDAGPGLGAATANMSLGRWDDAEQIATPLFASVRRADAAYIIGVSASQSSDHGRAILFLGLACAEHDASGDPASYARDAFALAGAWLELGQLEVARYWSAEAVTAATEAGDLPMVAYTALGRAEILRSVGAYAEAESEIDHASNLVSDPSDLAWLRLKKGLVLIDQEHEALAHTFLEDAVRLEMSLDAPRNVVLGAAYLNLAWLARKAGRLEEAHSHLESAASFGAAEMFLDLNRGLTLADAGELDQAADELARAEAAGPMGHWRWWIAYNRGLVAARRGFRDEAIAAQRRAITAIENLRQSAHDRARVFAAAHRQPAMQLFGLYAGSGMWHEALEVVATLDPAEITAIDSPRELSPSSIEPSQRRSSEYQDALTLDRHSGAEVILSAWRGRLLVAIVPDGTRMWRLVVEDGAVTGTDVGDADELERLAIGLEADPDTQVMAERLADVIIPPKIPAGATLDVLLVGQISRTPLAALRDHAGVLANVRFARAFALTPRAARPRTTASAVILADPTHGLPTAVDETAVVTAAIDDARTFIGPAATAAAFATARDASLLHLALHTDFGPDGPGIPLADGVVRGREIMSLYPAPSIVVLSTCGGASDHSGWSSLSSAFLAAGTDDVVATPWTIEDDAALQIIRAFYRHGGAHDPVVALSAAQRELSSTLSARAWAGFTVVRGPPRLP